MPYTAIYTDTGMWALLWGTAYAIHCHIQHIQGCRACSRGLYMHYTALYSTYRDVGPVLGDCICHTLPYTQILYRDVGPALGDCICHTLPYTAHTGMWGLLWGNVYAIHCHIQHIQGCGACSGRMYMPYTVIHCHIQHIQGCGASSRGLYMPYAAIYSTYRDVGPARGDCICHTLLYTAHTGMWALFWGTAYAIHCHIQHIQGCGPCSGGLYMPYTAIYSRYRDVGPSLGDCICHTLLYTADTGMWALLRGTVYAIHWTLYTVYAIHSLPPMHKEKVYPCPLYLPCTRKRSTHALYPSHTQGKGLNPCPHLFQRQEKGLSMSLSSSHKQGEGLHQ